MGENQQGHQMGAGAPARARLAMTMIEILVAVSVIMVLIGLLVPALAFVSHKARCADARQTLGELVTALELYRRDEERHRYPAVAVDLALSAAVLVTLDERGLWSWGSRQRDDFGRLLDPWGLPYRYSLTRPTPTAGLPVMQTWNWDAAAGRVARWGDRRDPTTGATVAGALPFPYLWSLGRAGNASDATEWLFMIDGK